MNYLLALENIKKNKKNLQKVQNQTENYIWRGHDGDQWSRSDGSFVDEDGDGWNDSVGPVFGPIIVVLGVFGPCCFICCLIKIAQTQQVIYQIFTIYY